MVLALRYPLCFLLLLLQQLLLPFSTTAQTYSNISLGSSLTAINNKISSWPSESGEFAFGFQQVEGGFLLAIWFNKIPEKTIVWSANRNQLAPSGSKIQLTTDGRFVLDDAKGNQIWSADSAGAGVSYAAMLDNGNFVLASNDSTNLWRSFDQPTDTILPTQTLNQDSKLLARFSETNYSKGRFLFILQTDGNLVMYTLEYPMETVESSNDAYWASGTVGSGFQVIFNQAGHIYLTAKNGTILNQISSADSPRDFYQRAVLEYDGVLRQYVYPKNASSSRGRWSMVWTPLFFMPENICTSMRSNTGGGVCGFNSYCRLGADHGPKCQCPPGYSLLDPNKNMTGCKQDFVPQSCDKPSQDTNRFGFQALPNTDWPLSGYERSQSVTEDRCRAACLGDCFCAVAIFRGGDCWKKTIPLSNGRTDPSVGGKALIKVGTANSTSQFEGGGPKKKDQSTLLGNKRLWIIIAISISLILLLLGFLCYKRKRKLRLQGEERERQEALIHELTTSERFKDANEVETNGREGRDLKIFSFACIMVATNNFSFENKLGQGGFGPVYKGKLPEGQKIAVKRLSRTSGQGLVEFKNELILIAKLQHMNLVRILGCCIHGEEKMLIYEYMSNKSLDYYIFDPTKRELLDWKKRSNIIEGVAQGLLYLHKYSRLRIIHRDLKASNILLDDNMNPKISDFGLARIFGQNETEAKTNRPVGTYGYMSPEYAIEGTFSIKSDVFSFGVIILEIMTGKKNYSSYHLDRPLNLIGYAWELWKEGAALELMDPTMGDSCPTHQLLRIIHLGLLCVQDSATDRPPMSDVISMLNNETMPLSDPKQPAFFTGRSVMEVNSHEGKSKDCSVNGLSISTMDAR